MAKLMVVLFALCVVPSIVAAPAKPLVLYGNAYLDNCYTGFLTTASTALVGAEVEALCTKRGDPSIVTYSNVTKTDSRGNYVMEIHAEDQGDNRCSVGLSGFHPECLETRTISSERSLVILTRNNGIVSDQRFANSLSCKATVPLTNCAQVMEQYVDNEADD